MHASRLTGSTSDPPERGVTMVAKRGEPFTFKVGQRLRVRVLGERARKRISVEKIYSGFGGAIHYRMIRKDGTVSPAEGGILRFASVIEAEEIG